MCARAGACVCLQVRLIQERVEALTDEELMSPEGLRRLSTSLLRSGSQSSLVNSRQQQGTHSALLSSGPFPSSALAHGTAPAAPPGWCGRGKGWDVRVCTHTRTPLGPKRSLRFCCTCLMCCAQRACTCVAHMLQKGRQADAPPPRSRQAPPLLLL